MPGSRAAKPDQLLVEASNPNSTPESMPRRQASTSNLRPKRSTSSLSSATASSSRTRKISTPSSDFTTSNYYTPQGSVSTLTPGSFSTTTLSPICASRHDDDDDDDSSELSRPPSPGSSSSRPISAYTVTEQADDTASTIGPPSEHGDETPQPGLEENIDHDTIYEAFNLFYTSAKTGESVSDPFEYVAEQLALRLREKRADQEFTKLDEQELEFAGLGFTLGNINSRAHLMLDNHQDENILPLKGRRGSRRGGCC